MATEKITKVNVNGQVYDLGGSGTGAGEVTNITYSELVSLMESSGLIAGAKYRITDYVTSFKDWKSGNHQFDIIVTAFSNNSFYEEAKAALHEGDDYFANSDLNSWKIWYDITNNKDKHQQANSSGKGTILRMIDEFGNDVDFDFKNAMFEVTTSDFSSIQSSLYFYLFSYYEKSVKQLTQSDILEGSVNSNCKVVHNRITGLSLSATSNRDYIVFGVKKGLIANLNPVISYNEIISPVKEISSSVLLISEGIGNYFELNKIYGGLNVNNPISIVRTELKGNFKLDIPYCLNSFVVDCSKFINQGNTIQTIKANNIVFGKALKSCDFVCYGDTGHVILNDISEDIMNASFKVISGSSDVTINESNLSNCIISVKEASYKITDLSV